MSQFSFQRELLRKSLHLIVIIFPLLLLEFGKVVCLPYFLTISLLFIALDISRLKFTQVEELYNKFFAIVTKDYEQSKLTSASYVFLALLITTFLFNESIAAAGLIIMILADPMASLFGRVFGNFKLVGNKTIEGSIAFFIAASIVLLSLGFSAYHVIVVALGSSCIELFSQKIKVDDNLLIPLVSSSLLFIL